MVIRARRGGSDPLERPVQAGLETSTRPAPGDQLASDIKALVAAGDDALARDRFQALVELHQRRASRIAYHYLRDAAEADEAVQDAFVKVFTKIATYREELPFAVWFNRILVNGCLDRQKARARRNRWFLPLDSDCLLLPDALDTVLQAMERYGGRRPVLLFPCLAWPGLHRLDA